MRLDASLGGENEQGFHAGIVCQFTDVEEGLHQLGWRAAKVVVKDLHEGSQMGIGEVWSLRDFEALRMEIVVESMEKNEESTWFVGHMPFGPLYSNLRSEAQAHKP